MAQKHFMVSIVKSEQAYQRIVHEYPTWLKTRNKKFSRNQHRRFRFDQRYRVPIVKLSSAKSGQEYLPSALVL
jgi:hypothetical protein